MTKIGKRYPILQLMKKVQFSRLKNVTNKVISNLFNRPNNSSNT